MKLLQASKARELIRQLNRMDLERADFGYIKEQVSKLFVGLQLRAFMPRKDVRLYRGVRYKEKPTLKSQLGYPPEHLVVNFQRCNPPGMPVFYCSPDPGAVFFELNVQPGECFYISKWSVCEDFYVIQMAPEVEDGEGNYLSDMVSTFFETKFLQPIHATYSSQYKITAAIAERMMQGTIDESSDVEVGGMTYPSVSHPGRSDNLAIRSAIVDSCLRLDYVEEIFVKDIRGTQIDFERRDFSSKFLNGNIEWKGELGNWDIPPGAGLTITKEPDGWVARNERGVIVDPA
ncbi:RES domain-containing protein [Polaromonas sp. CT11-55]|uniref:RES domain-containing protein n=1 Tax=Polaromonas sp. CT11-55 TaxID=3243045 RepID=UPI0039A75EEE